MLLLAIEDQFYLKPFPCGQESCDLGSKVQKLKPASKTNDFEVLDLRPEIKFMSLRSLNVRHGILDKT